MFCFVFPPCDSSKPPCQAGIAETLSGYSITVNIYLPLFVVKIMYHYIAFVGTDHFTKQQGLHDRRQL